MKTDFLNKPRIKNLDDNMRKELHEDMVMLFEHLYDLKDKYGDNLQIALFAEAMLSDKEDEAYISDLVDTKDTEPLHRASTKLMQIINTQEEHNRFSGVIHLKNFRVRCKNAQDAAPLEKGKQYIVNNVKMSKKIKGQVLFVIKDVTTGNLIGEYDSRRFDLFNKFYEIRN